MVFSLRDTAGQTHPILKTLRIGRDAANQIVLEDKKVSRLHCTLLEDQGSLTLRDENSSNGTFVNQTQIQGSVRIQPGDVLTLGDTSFVVEQVPDLPPLPAATPPPMTKQPPVLPQPPVVNIPPAVNSPQPPVTNQPPVPPQPPVVSAPPAVNIPQPPVMNQPPMPAIVTPQPPISSPPLGMGQPQPVPVASLPKKKNGISPVFPMIFIVLGSLLCLLPALGGYIYYKAPQAEKNKILNLFGKGPATIQLENFSDNTVFVFNTTTLDRSVDDGSSAEFEWEVGSFGTQEINDQTAGVYRMDFGTQAGGMDLGTCIFKLKGGEVYHFVVMPDYIIIDRTEYPPSSNRDPKSIEELNVETSSLCQYTQD